MANRKTFADIAAARKHYNPDQEGYGNPEEWTAAFRERMGIEEAQEVLGTKGPRAVLGVLATATWGEIVKAFRRKVMETHPDRIAASACIWPGVRSSLA